MIRISAYLLSSAIGSVIMFPQLIMFFFFVFLFLRVSQGSADSNYSQPSSDLSLDDEREALRRETERLALAQLDKARVSAIFFFFCCAAKPTGIENNFLLSLSLPHSPFFFFLPPPRRAASGWRRDFCSFLPMILLLLLSFSFCVCLCCEVAEAFHSSCLHLSPCCRWFLGPLRRGVFWVVVDEAHV